MSLRFALIALVVAAFAQSGCRENTLINSKVAPNNSTIGVYDTSLDCITHTYYDDTLITSTNIGGLAIYQGVGALSDPFFGTMTGATYFQVVPNSFNSALYDNAQIDSVVMILPYSGYTYGDTASALTTTLTYQAFYMSDSLSYDGVYFSSTSKAADLALSDPTTISLSQMSDTFSVNGTGPYMNGLRIRLKWDVLWSKLQSGQSILTSSSAPATDFIRQFNGICVRVADPSQTKSVYPYFRLDGSSMYNTAGFLVYYHDKTSGVAASPENYSFNTSYCSHFNSIARSYASSPVNNLYHSTQANDSIIALQNQPGASIDVVVPGISKLPAGVINKAELQFTLLSYNNPTSFQGPEKLYPLGIGNGVYPVGVSAGVAYNVLDRYPLTSLSPLSVMDGYVHTFTRNGKTVQTYTIGIPREVMSSLASKNDVLHLHINGTQDFYGAFHMVAGGGSYPDPTYRPKLFVVYSKLK